MSFSLILDEMYGGLVQIRQFKYHVTEIFSKMEIALKRILLRR